MSDGRRTAQRRRIRQATNGPCTFHRPRQPNCGRPREDETVHSWPEERLRPGTHVWRREYADINRPGAQSKEKAERPDLANSLGGFDGQGGYEA
jgi:hypothetical protein